MKIGIFTDTYYPQINGVTVSIDNFSEELRKKGHTVYIFAPKIRRWDQKDPFVIRLPSFKVLSSEPEVRFPIPVLDKSMKAIYNLHLDIVHAHGNGAFSFLGYQVSRMRGIPYVLSFHTFHTKYTHYFFDGKVVKPRMVATGMRVFGNWCDGVITPSEKMKKELVKYGVKRTIKVIPNFIDYDRFQNGEKGYLHKQLRIPQNSPIVLSVGRLGKEKNFAFIIKAFAMYLKKEAAHRIKKEAHLVIVGKGPEKKELAALVRSLKLTKRIHFTDGVSYKLMPHLYADSDLFVFSSKTETQGMCLLEASASGLPLLVVKDAAFNLMIKHGRNGYELPLQQKLFAEKIDKILTDDALRARFSKNSKEIAKKNCHGEKITDELIRFYDEIFSQYNPKNKMLRKVSKATFVRIMQAPAMLEWLFLPR